MNVRTHVGAAVLFGTVFNDSRHAGTRPLSTRDFYMSLLGR